MAAKKEIVDFVRHTSRPFIFCASIPPANCATALAALKKLKEHPELPRRLSELSDYMRQGLKKRNIPVRQSKTPIIPIYTYDVTRTLVVAKKLYDNGVYVNPVLPPATAPGECLLRTSLMASHTFELLDEAMDIIKKVLDEEK